MQNLKRPNRFNRLFLLFKSMAVLLAVAAVLKIIAVKLESMEQQAESQEAYSLAEQARLADISEHLKNIDQIVLANKENLSGLNLGSAGTEKTLAGFSEIFTELESHITATEAGLKDFAETSGRENTTANDALTAIFNRQQEIGGQIAAAAETVTNLLSGMRSGNEGRFSETFGRLAALQKTNDAIKKNVAEYHKDLVGIIGLFQEENRAGHEELLETLAALAGETDALMAERFTSLQLQLYQDYSDLTHRLDSLYEQIGSTGQSLTDALSVMAEQEGSRGQEIREQVTAATESMAALLSLMKSDNGTLFSENFEKLAALQKTNDNIRERADAYHKELMATTGASQAESQAGHQELAGTLITLADELDGLIREQFSTLQALLRQEYAALANQMDSLHMHISTTGQSITALLAMMAEQDKSRQEEIYQSFAAVSHSLNQIDTDFNAAHTKMQGLISILQETGADNHAETLSVLAALEDNMALGASQSLSRITGSLSGLQKSFEASLDGMGSRISEGFTGLQEAEADYYGKTLSALAVLEGNVADGADQNFSGITSSLSGLQQNLEASIRDVQGKSDQNFSALGTGIDNRFTEYSRLMAEQMEQINSSVTGQYGSLTAIISQNHSGQQASYDTLLNEIRKDLQSVFQSVSSGKKKLASALLTKGITVKEDATFQEIQQGIMEVPQQVTIGADLLPGTIEYHYHYHTDGSGNEPHQVNNAAKGGCYTVPVYHAHTSSCYKTRYYHSHNDSCPGHPMWVHWMNPPYWGWAHDCGNQPQNASEQVLNCPKNSGTVDAYKAGCGLSDGQIIGADIRYAQGIQAMRAGMVPLLEPAGPTELMEISGLPEDGEIPGKPDLPEEIQGGPDEPVEIPDKPNPPEEMPGKPDPPIEIPDGPNPPTEMPDKPDPPEDTEMADDTGTKEETEPPAPADEAPEDAYVPTVSGNALEP